MLDNSLKLKDSSQFKIKKKQSLYLILDQLFSHIVLHKQLKQKYINLPILQH